MGLILIVHLYFWPGPDVALEPTDPKRQQEVIDELQLQLWGKPGQNRNTCQSALFSSCAPTVYDS